MKIIFAMPSNRKDVYNDILKHCDTRCTPNENDNLTGDQIIAISAIISPIVWELISKYLPDPQVTIQYQLDEETIITVSDRSYKRAKMKFDRLKADWEKSQPQAN